MKNRAKPDDETLEQMIGFYTAYLCGTLDTLVIFRGSLYATDLKQVIVETIESIIKDAWELQSKGQV